MSRPPVIPAEKKIRIVLSVLQGEVSIAEAARREKVSEQAIGNWKRQFLEGGKAGIEAGKSKPTSREPRNAAPPHCRSPARPGTRTWPPSASTPASKTPGKKTPPPNSPSEEVGELGSRIIYGSVRRPWPLPRFTLICRESRVRSVKPGGA